MGVNVRNIAFRIAPEDLATFVAGARAAGIRGLMVTIPHKVAARGLVDDVDAFGAAMGAVNLIHFSPEGVRGYNTDGYAASRSLEEQGIRVAGARVTILGAGGAGRCLAKKFALDGAAAVTILNRTETRAQALAAEVRRQSKLDAQALPLTAEALAETLTRTDLLVNTTSVGMSPEVDRSPVPAELLRPDLAVYDIVYNPVYDPKSERYAILLGRFSGTWNKGELSALLAELNITVQDHLDKTTDYVIVGGELYADEDGEPLEEPAYSVGRSNTHTLVIASHKVDVAIQSEALCGMLGRCDGMH
jgi:shikimate dehydrogenase